MAELCRRPGDSPLAILAMLFVIAITTASCSWHRRGPVSERAQAIMELQAHYALIQEYQLRSSGKYDESLKPGGASRFWLDVAHSYEGLASLSVSCTFHVSARSFDLRCSWIDSRSQEFGFVIDNSNIIRIMTHSNSDAVVVERRLLVQYARGDMRNGTRLLCLTPEVSGDPGKLLPCPH